MNNFDEFDDYDDDFDDDFNIVFTYYDFDKVNAALSTLIDIDSRIYDLTFKEMLPLEKQNQLASMHFEKCLKKLRILKSKENRIISSIASYISIEDVDNEIEMYIAEFSGDDKEKEECIRGRISYVFNKIELEQSDLFYYEEHLEAQINFKQIADMHLAFIKSMNPNSKKYTRLLKLKYERSFNQPEIETELLFAGFNAKNLVKTSIADNALSFGLTISDETSTNHKPDIETYKIMQEQTYFYYIQDVISDLLVIGPEDNIDLDKIRNELDEIKYVLRKMKASDIRQILEAIELDLENNQTISLDMDTNIAETIYNMVKKAYEKKTNITYEKNIPIINDEILDNSQNDKFSQELIEQLFKLVKLSCEIYSTGMKLCKLEIRRQKSSNQFNKTLEYLQDLLQKEREVAQNISECQEISDAIFDIIINHITFIAEIDKLKDLKGLFHLCKNDSNRNDIVTKRLVDIIPTIKTPNDNLYQSSDVPDYITQSHQIKVLKRFEKTINEALTVEERTSLITVKYEAILSDSNLTEDFFSTNTNIKNLLDFDDDFLAYLLGIEPDEYHFDKTEVLYNFSEVAYTEILKTMLEAKSPLEQARIEFKKVYLQVAMESLDEEMAKKLEDSYGNIEELQKTYTKKHNPK